MRLLRTYIAGFCKLLRRSGVIIFQVGVWSLPFLQRPETPLHNKYLDTAAGAAELLLIVSVSMFHSSKKNLDSGPMSQKLFSVSRKHGGTFNLCFIHSKQGAYPSFRILNAKKVFILWGLLKWVSYAVCLLEHRPCMLHKTDILPSQGNLWSSRFSSHLSEL